VAKTRKAQLKARLPKSKEAAAAAVLTGAAAVGGKLAKDRLASGHGQEDGRAFQLGRGEFVPDGMRRISRGQLDDGIEELAGQPNRKLDEAVHATRKRLKRLRAALRLARSAIGDETYRHENDAFRDMGRRLSGPRDAMVLIETLDALADRFGEELPPDATAALRDELEQTHQRALAKLRRSKATIEAVRGELEAARARSASWTYDADGFDALRPGLERIYRRGRRSMRAAVDDPSMEHLHEWRKRAKDFWHAVEILRPAAPKRMKRLAKRAHWLSDLLGDDHDLAVLRQQVVLSHAIADRDARAAVLAAIDRRRASLQRRAFKLGARIYGPRPTAFARSVERSWRKRAPKHPAPVAG
jgi:CHAD domain-containing protein